MSSEIRAGDNRTYWIISNGNSYVDGVTDPTLVTTVGNGWHIYWIGSDYSEYLKSCNNCNIIPRNTDPNTPSISNNYPKVSARQVRLWLVNREISLSSVEQVIDSIEDPILREKTRVEWEYAPYIERSHPMLIPLSSILGLTSADLDQAFAEAINL
jgi:hypothetical protein